MFLRTLIFITIAVTFCLLLLGGHVHNTQSSLACPDWPTCYGSFMPEMKGNVAIEHGHRLLATFVGMLTIALVVLFFKKRKQFRHQFDVGALALIFVITQGLLGGITVIYKLPTIVSSSHLGLAMIFFLTLVYLHHSSFKLKTPTLFSLSEGQKKDLKFKWNSLAPHLLFLSLFILYLQIILGAFMRHSGAGAACGLGFENSIACLEQQSWTHTFWPSLDIAKLHMAHRLFAMVVFLFASFSLVNLWLKLKKYNLEKIGFLKFLIIAIFFLYLGQIALGVLTVAYNISPLPTVLHLGVAALLLALTFKLFLLSRELEIEIYGSGQTSFLSDVIDLMKPKLCSLVLLTAFVGMLLAPDHVNFFRGMWILFCISLVVFGAAALNCYLEKDVDALMERTKNRPLPAGRFNPDYAFWIGTLMILVALGLIYKTINPITAFLSALSALLYLGAYTPLKKYSWFALVVGAVPGAIPPVLGWTAVTGRIDGMAIILFLIIFVWQLPHFMAISLFHAEDYHSADIKVLPNIIGPEKTKWLIFLTTVILFVISLGPKYFGANGNLYQVAALILSSLFLLLAIAGFFQGKDLLKQRNWARQYFWGSIIYLPLLFAAIVFLK